MTAVLISIRPKWCDLIARGKKTVEIRKTKPKIEPPFKVYIYCTKSKPPGWFNMLRMTRLDGKVIGEFVCCDVEHLCLADLVVKEDAESALRGSCLTKKKVLEHLKYERGTDIHQAKQFDFYAWKISDLVLYEEPKYLGEFQIKAPPQSWRYVERIEAEND